MDFFSVYEVKGFSFFCLGAYVEKRRHKIQAPTFSYKHKAIMTSFLKGMFSEKCIVDDRDPLLRFTMPLLVDDTTEFGLFAPKFEPWKQLAIVRLKILFVFVLDPFYINILAHTHI